MAAVSGKSLADTTQPPLRAAVDGLSVSSDLPAHLPVANEEIGILRAFLSDAIDEILWPRASADDAPKRERS